MRVTLLGHALVLVEIDSERAPVSTRPSLACGVAGLYGPVASLPIQLSSQVPP